MWTFVALVLSLGVVRTVHGDCDRPTGGSNMVLIPDVTFPVPDGTSVTFSCEVGYRRVGSGTVACSAGTWSSLKMTCEIINCGSADEVTNGRVDYSEGTEFGAFAHVVCNDGYMVVGFENRIVCGLKGWEGRLASCEVTMCDPPNPIANGYFSPVKDSYEHSEVITYTCDGQHVLNGSKTVTCQDNGQLHPVPPKCVLVNCLDPRVDNGVLAGGARPPFGHQNSVTFRCEVGHTMEGQGTVTCDINSKWSPALPKCNPTECTAPEITNGEVVGGARPTYKFEETITLKCKTGYSLRGQSTLTCKAKNQWSPALPTCTLIECQTPVVQGGVLVGGPRPSYKYLDSVTFECKSGYVLSGESTLTCDVNSQWSPKLPQCTMVVCKSPEVTHGEVVEGARPSYKYMDAVVVECKNGYTMTGQSKQTCALNSQWSPGLPLCTQDKGGNNGDTVKIVLSVLGVLLALSVIGCCVYFGLLKKKKGAGKEYTGAPQDAETVALS